MFLFNIPKYYKLSSSKLLSSIFEYYCVGSESYCFVESFLSEKCSATQNVKNRSLVHKLMIIKIQLFTILCKTVILFCEFQPAINKVIVKPYANQRETLR